MRKFLRPAAIGLIPLAALLAGCATETTTAAKIRPKSVPSISVVIDCEKCDVRSTVPELIRSGYAAAAVKAGARIDGDRQFTLTIKDYGERALAVRLVSLAAGPLAFALKDEIKAVALVDGKQLPVEYGHRSPFSDIEVAAQRLGELSFDSVAKELGCSKNACQ